jgi:hypothetical protein
MTEEIYDNYKDELYNIIVVEDNTKELYERYLKESEGKTYIEWLENIVLSQSINKL